MPSSIIDGPGGKLLVGGHERGGDVVSQEIGERVDVKKLDDVFVTDDPTSARVRDLLGRHDLPVVVGIVVRVTRDLLTCVYRTAMLHV